MIFNKILKDQETVLNLIYDSFHQKSNICLTYFNQHCFNIYFSDKSYRYLIDSHFFLYLDGIGIYFALKVFGYRNVQKFNASDLNDIIFSELIKRNIKVFIIGGKFSDNLINNIAREKKLNICGYHKGYFDDTELSNLVSDINDSGAEVILVGMGVPKQEILTSRLSNSVDVNFILSVGSYLEFYLGTRKRIPAGLRNKGVEWLFRLFLEPSRLWKRYLIGIPLFMLRLLQLSLFHKRTDERYSNLTL